MSPAADDGPDAQVAIDEACLAYVCGEGVAPVGVQTTNVLAGAIRAVALRAKASRPADDGIRLDDLVRYRAEPGDVIVAYVPAMAASAHVERIRLELMRAFGTSAVVVSCGVGLEVIHPAEVPVVP